MKGSRLFTRREALGAVGAAGAGARVWLRRFTHKSVLDDVGSHDIDERRLRGDAD
jgi:hypothetical protein